MMEAGKKWGPDPILARGRSTDRDARRFGGAGEWEP